MKRRIIKGQEGTSNLLIRRLDEFTPEELAELRRLYELAHPKVETNFDRAMRYLGYVLNPIFDPIGTVDRYVQESEWTPDWLKEWSPYLGLGLGLAAGRGAPRRINTGQATKVHSDRYRGQPRTTKEAEKFIFEDQTGRKLGADGYAKTKNPKLESTNEGNTTEVSYEDALGWKPSSKGKTAEGLSAKQTSQEATLKAPSTKMFRTGSGRNTAALNTMRDNMYERGTGISHVTSKSAAKKSITNYFTAMQNKFNRLLGQLTEFELAGKVSEAADIRRQLKQAKSDFEVECTRVKTLGHEVNVPTELQDLMLFK